ncbi:MAG: YjgP/YjgQ family permease [Ignavibacteriae bacterium]|nr:MAG: YjgP/YjgQ family permease [Ignavibacteriota bacterium]
MKILDRYIIRQFLVAFLFGLLAFICVFIIIDMMEKLDDFIDAHAPTTVIVQYYIASIPDIVKLMIPVAVLLSALFVTGRLSSQNELSAIKSSGTSLYRIMAPFFIITFFICLASFYLNGWIVPYANQNKFYIERTHLNRSGQAAVRNILFQEGRTRIVSINFYDSQSMCARQISIQDFDKNDLTILRQRYDAQQMQWIQKNVTEANEGEWVLIHGTTRSFFDTSQTLVLFDSLKVGRLSLTPSDMEKKQRTPDEMDYNELREFIANQQKAGQDVARWLVEYHFKIAFPFASIIMVLFGVPFAASRPRTGAALGFGIATAVTFIYLGFMKASQVFGYNGDLNPLFTAWLANIIFFAAGIINLLRVQK